jgi:hypothetical protein
MKYPTFDIKNGIFLHFLTIIKAKISCNGYTTCHHPSPHRNKVTSPFRLKTPPQIFTSTI